MDTALWIALGFGVVGVLVLIGILSWPWLRDRSLCRALHQIAHLPTERLDIKLLQPQFAGVKGLKQMKGLPTLYSDSDPVCNYLRCLGYKNPIVTIGKSHEQTFVIRTEIGGERILVKVGEPLHNWLMAYHEYPSAQLNRVAESCSHITASV